jgi:4-amino-4-deoxy-L-arabinose transferase-like glycosyltransferase
MVGIGDFTVARLRKHVFNRWSVVLFFFALVVSFKAPILNTPHYWDSLNKVHNANWIKDNHFNPFLEKGEGMLRAQGRPPFFLQLLALSWSIFGNSLIVSHVIVILFSFLGVLFTYLLGTFLFSKSVGIISSLLLFFSPLYFAQSGILNLAIPLTALSVMTLYFAVKENVKGYLVCAVFLLLTKETGILILFPILLALSLRHYKKPESGKTILIYLLPFLFYLLWLVACRLYLGWFFYPSHQGILNFHNPAHVVRTFLERSWQLFFKNYHWLLFLFIVMTAKKWATWVQQEKGKGIIVFGGIAMYLLFFSVYSVPLDRYVLPAYPLLYILFAKSIDHYFTENWRLSFSVLLLMTFLFVSAWRGNRSGFGFELETNLEYLDFVEVHQKASRFIEDNLADRHILTDWPQTMELRYPFEGYVTKPIRTSSIFEEYDLREIDIVYFVPQSAREFVNLVNQLELTSLAEFEKNGKRAEIFELQTDR